MAPTFWFLGTEDLCGPSGCGSASFPHEQVDANSTEILAIGPEISPLPENLSKFSCRCSFQCNERGKNEIPEG